MDEGATRNTPEVNVLVRRENWGTVAGAMTAAGFDHRIVKGVNGFVDRPDGNERSGIYFWFAGERVRESDVLPMPELTEAVQGSRFKVISLEALVRMKLTSFRRKDQVHLQDLLRQGLIDDTWPARFPDTLAERLREPRRPGGVRSVQVLTSTSSGGRAYTVGIASALPRPSSLRSALISRQRVNTRTMSQRAKPLQ